MKTLLVVAALLSVATAQTTQSGQFKIKGHQIGESVADFLKLETATQNQLNDCHTNPPRAISVDEVKRRKYPDGTTKRDYVELARQGRLYDRNVEDYNRKCNPLLSIFDSAGTGEVVTDYSNPNTVTTSSATWQFEGGKIVGLQMIVFGQYGEVRDDLTAKAGMKLQELSIPYHNGFGATWSDRHAEWTTHDLHVALYQNNSPLRVMSVHSFR